ncbi:MAG: DUF2284 domain-containing protein [Eggerthellaceae bacterium]|nr:DUF2284 domain-containing protein [Eggerthellaceae bacterium]
MPDVKATVKQLVEEVGFDCSGICTTEGFRTRPEVRDMCAANLCQHYDKSWSCPPACGEIEDYEQRMRTFDNCIVVQTVGQMEDSFDFETVQEAAETQDKRFRSLVQGLHEQDLEFMPLGAGTCMLCKECSYPDNPGRFPDKMVVSMEAAGLMVNEICTKADIPYNHGENTISFTGCILY